MITVLVRKNTALKGSKYAVYVVTIFVTRAFIKASTVFIIFNSM